MDSTFPEPLPKPDKTRCVQCGQPESPSQPLRGCGKCRTAPYCSVECQKADWKSHKLVCNTYIMDKSLNYSGIYISEKGPKVKKGEVKRTRGQILYDLRIYAENHNGDTLTISAWNLMGLVNDITRAKTHFFLLTLRRTSSSNPRTLYSLIDAEVLPFSLLEEVYSNRSTLETLAPVSPRAMLEQDEEGRKREGALGSVMVLSIELPKGDNRPPRDALKEVGIHILQPLGLFKVHKDSLSRFPRLSRDLYIRCLKNSLDGGAYTLTFQPYIPVP